jgi:hypothetical protein
MHISMVHLATPPQFLEQANEKQTRNGSWAFWYLLLKWGGNIDNSQDRLLFGFSLLYTDRVTLDLLDSAALL